MKFWRGTGNAFLLLLVRKCNRLVLRFMGHRRFPKLEESTESEIEKRIGVKVNELMKEVDQIITFLRALSEDVGLRLNKLFAQVDNIVVPLTNTVIKMEEAADHLTTFRETSQRTLESLAILETTSKQALVGLESFKAPDLNEAATQVAAIRTEGVKALETVKQLAEAAKTLPSGKASPSGQGELTAISGESRKALEAIKSLEEASQRLVETGSNTLETLKEAQRASKQVLDNVHNIGIPSPREPEAPVEPQAPPAKAPSRRAAAVERETRPAFGGGPPPPPPEPVAAPPPSRAPATSSSHIYSTSAEQMFAPVEEALNSTAGTVAKSILDARDKIMGMTRKFVAIYDLASTARELARFPQRTLDKREKEVILDKLMTWKSKLSEALTQS
jgi:hypothetical protein